MLDYEPVFPATRRGTDKDAGGTPALPGNARRAHHSEEQPFVNEGTRTDGPPSTTTGGKMLLHFCPVGVTLSWEEAPPGARASRPHKSSRSFGHLLHRNQPAAAPCLCFGRAHAVPAGRAVGCNIAGKLSGNRRDSMRAGRPRSREMHDGADHHPRVKQGRAPVSSKAPGQMDLLQRQLAAKCFCTFVPLV